MSVWARSFAAKRARRQSQDGSNARGQMILE